MNEKMKIVIGAVVTGTVVLGAVVAMGIGDMGSSELLMVFGAVALSLGSLYFVKDKLGDMKKGLPTEDELSKQIMNRAGALSYYFTIWLAIAIMWIDTLYFKDVLGTHLTTMEIVGAIVLVSGGFFIGTAIFLKKLGRV